ncbi:transcriptional regulator Rpn4p [[Candida] anglica]|uniref:Transcriptional regulator Rpn4p n=1 Tax=[Candida] anglica TaxID=148631 RepID=A0ABP0EFC9_9ASCO
MASITVLPPLKRTITDIMEEDLYHLPNSPIHLQSSGGGASGVATGLNATGSFARPDSPRLATRHNSIGSSTNFAPSMPSLTNAQLSNLLNIPDSFVEQYTRLSNTVPYTADPVSFDVDQQQQQHLNQEHQSYNSVKSPFADYANPDSLNSQYIAAFAAGSAPTGPQGANSHNNTSSNPFSRRRRLTTLESHSNEKPIRDEDYYLFNTDIQPSHLVTRADGDHTNDDYVCLNSPLYVPPTTAQDIPIPGFENDYLMMSGAEDFEEEIEEDTSDEEDDNYFHDDFDDMFLSKDNEFMDTDTFFNNNNQNVMGGPEMIDNLESTPSMIPQDVTSPMGSQEYPTIVNNDEQDHNMIIDESEEIEDDDTQERSSFSSVSTQVTTPSSRDNDQYLNKSKDYEQYDQYESHISHTVAEITANNPNHQCDLINPSTGKPCSKQFSRPYDLIRHQETIHATKKKIFRCVICEGRVNGGLGNGKQKTFSRGDALSRHIKVKHGLVGKEALELINEAKANVEFVSV